jgi:hypothetical protein
MSIFADELFLNMVSLTSLPASIFLTPITTWTPRNASTRAVSIPIPLVAPTVTWTHNKNNWNQNEHQCEFHQMYPKSTQNILSHSYLNKF